MPKHATGEPVAGNPYRIRDPYASSLTEIWIVSAVVTILAIRGYLAATGYPQVGGDSLHIAHMLWGGLGMVIGLGMLLMFAHPVWKPIAAVVSGAGFGCFIDELGKFITNDNDYFYQPTIALIYAIFVVLFLASRYFERKRQPTEADHLYLALQGVQWLAIGKLDERRQRVALDHLNASGNVSPLADELRTMLTSASLVHQGEQSRILDLRQWLVDRYWTIVGNHWLERIVVGMFVIKGVMLFVELGVLVAVDAYSIGDGLSTTEWGSTAANIAGGAVAAFGLVRLLQRQRIAALKAFAASVLISLLFGAIFAFAATQFYALVTVGFNMIILGVLRFALSVEDQPEPAETAAERGTPAPAAAGQLT